MTISPSLQQAQDAGFKLGGEPSIALDLIDTVLHAHGPDSTDLLLQRSNAWWELQSSRLPHDDVPSTADTDRLRAGLREVIEARIDGRPPTAEAIGVVNEYAESASPVPRLRIDGIDQALETVWRQRGTGNARLAAIARDAIELVTDARASARLRRCANPTCTMVFLADNPRRVWCAANVCGNRMRVARHHRRLNQVH